MVPPKSTLHTNQTFEAMVKRNTIWNIYIYIYIAFIFQESKCLKTSLKVTLKPASILITTQHGLRQMIKSSKFGLLTQVSHSCDSIQIGTPFDEIGTRIELCNSLFVKIETMKVNSWAQVQAL